MSEVKIYHTLMFSYVVKLLKNNLKIPNCEK